MKISIPSIYAQIPLREYDEQMQDLFAQVWVNPSLDLMREQLAITQERVRILSADYSGEEEETKPDVMDRMSRRLEALNELRPREYAWLADILGHGGDSEKRWSPDAQELEDSYQTSPDFMAWLTERVTTAITDHRAREKKVSAPRSMAEKRGAAPESTTPS